MDNNPFGPKYLPGHTVKVIRSDGVSSVRIKGVRPLPSHEHDFGALTAGTALTAQVCTHLELEAGEMAQFWLRIRDQFEVEILHPRSTNYFNTKLATNAVGANWRIRPYYGSGPDETPDMLNFHLLSSEFWVWEDDTPRFDLYPFNSAQNPQGHVEFMGWRYSVDDIGGVQTVSELRVNKFD